MEIIFLISIILILHAYFGYPATLLFISKFKSKVVEKSSLEIPVTLIITACNEEKRIKEKMENTIKLQYPSDMLQVIVASDGSNDKTNEIVEDYQNKNIHLLAFKQRRGKENAQKEAVKQATGDIIIFSDVATQIQPHGLMEIVANFSDPSVGCVSSVDKIIGPDGLPCGEGLYVRYEMSLRKLESKVSSLVGLSGSFFAARKEVCQDFSGEMQSDFRTVLNSIKLGLRGISDPDVVGFYPDVADNKREFERKIRTVLRGQTVFFRNLEFLNFTRYGIFSYEYFCHKLLRWLVPFFMVIALFSNIVIAIDSYFFMATISLQIIFYILAAWGLIFSKKPALILRVPVYFLTVNVAILFSWIQFVRGKRMVMWTPSNR